LTNRQTDRQTKGQTVKQTDTQKVKQTYRRRYKQIDRQTVKQTGLQTDRHGCKQGMTQLQKPSSTCGGKGLISHAPVTQPTAHVHPDSTSGKAPIPFTFYCLSECSKAQTAGYSLPLCTSSCTYTTVHSREWLARNGTEPGKGQGPSLHLHTAGCGSHMIDDCRTESHLHSISSVIALFR
jgi:hypothetical protein